MNYLADYVRIKDGVFAKNGEPVFQADAGKDFATLIRDFYKSLEIQYPAFYKMDNLSKLGFVAAELLLKDNDWFTRLLPNETGIILANESSCLATDQDYFDTIKDRSNYFPSPAVFVYTLPNIVIGEISIRHKIQGENTFFLQPEFDSGFLTEYVDDLLNRGILKAVLSGWLDFYQDKYDAFMYFASSERIGEKALSHNKDNIQNLFNS